MIERLIELWPLIVLVVAVVIPWSIYTQRIINKYGYPDEGRERND
jgi:hypothetical protein